MASTYSFIWPTTVTKRISSFAKFGARNGKHTGLDFGKKNNTVVAAAAGTVRFVGDMQAGGMAVWITHVKGYETRYLHLQPGSVTVSKGSAVQQGDQIARVGYSGLESVYGDRAPLAAHLHFEIRFNGTPQDPETLLPPSPYGSAASASGYSLVDKAIAAGLYGPNGEPAWYWVEDNGSPRYTKGGLPADAPTPSSKAVWPLKRKRPLKVFRFIEGKGPNSGRCIGYRRSNGARAHCGIDLCAKHGDVVVAVDDGTIVGFYHFYRGTFALLIDHGDYVINYGEVDRSSLDKFGLKTPRFKDGTKERGATTRVLTSSDIEKYGSEYPWLATEGSSVSAGQNIAIIGKMNRSSMLHFEMYSSGNTTQSWPGFPDQKPPSRLLNPTNFLLVLSGRKKEEQPSAPEGSAVDICR
jgi:murein DD-endopeptidase MepM/ murein hydrolase activator NlpD